MEPTTLGAALTHATIAYGVIISVCYLFIGKLKRGALGGADNDAI